MIRRVIIALAVCAFLAAQSDSRSPSTRKMASLLKLFYEQQDFKTDPNKARERADYYRAILTRQLDLHTEIVAHLDLADHLIVAGDSAAAVDELEKFREKLAKGSFHLDREHELRLRRSLAIAYLRMGEQQNCVENHNAQSCVYPLRGGGVHRNRKGADGAIREYTALLELDPSDLASKWLLNIAYMAVGRHPDGVPAKWLIPDSIVPDEFDIKPFHGVAAQAGVAITTHAGGAAAEDFDGDGYFDLMISSSGPNDQLRYFRNKRDGTFADETAAAGLTGITGGLNLIHADYDNDGHADVLVLRGGWWGGHGKYPPSLLRNNGPDSRGQLTFTDVTEAARLMSSRPTQTAAWADFDSDGFIDLFLGHESSVEEVHPSQLFRNNGDGTFTDIAAKAGIANAGYVKGVAWGDYNNDGRPDLYISRKGALNLLYRNDGSDEATGWKFTDVTKAAGVEQPLHSFPTWFFDYDNDGWLDLFVAGYFTETLADIPAFHLGLKHRAETPRLYRNQRDGTFKEVSREAKLDRVILAMGSAYGDLDNDGWLDCYFGTGAPEYETLLPNRMFRNDRGKRFLDVTRSGGFGQLQKGHAISFADFDRDGDQDIFEVLGGAYPGDTYISTLIENPGHGHQRVNLRLEGVKSNRAAIGARVRVVTEAGAFHRTVQPGSSFGDSPFELHVGLGAAKTVRAVEIRWPSGLNEQISGVQPGGVFRIREGSGRAQPVMLKAFRFGAEQHHRH